MKAAFFLPLDAINERWDELHAHPDWQFPSPPYPAFYTILDGLAAQDPWTKIVGPRFTSEPYGLAISQQHPDFVRFVNAVLQQLRTDGQWAASYAHWVGTPVPAPPPAHYKA